MSVTQTETPLLTAVKAGKSDAAKALLAAGADVKTRDLGGCSPLDWAATNGDADMLKAILRHRAEANGCNLLGLTALHRASASTVDTEDAVKALIEGGADTEFPNEQGRTPLSDATRRFDSKKILVLLRNGVDPNTRGSQNNTPLHEACMRRFPGLATVVDLLLRWGADEHACNNDGLCPEQTLALDQAVDCWCSAEENTRTRRLLEFAKENRIWRRQGWLVVLRSRALEEASGDNHNGGDGGDGGGDGDEDEEADSKGRAECLRRRTGESAADGGGGGCGSAACNEAQGLSLMKMLLQTPEGVFRKVVKFL